MSIYQQNSDFIGIVFSNSNSIIKEALSNNLTVLLNVKRNQYKMPYFRSLLVIMKQYIQAQFYGYMNSDILLNPRVFQLLQNNSILFREGFISNTTELVSRVVERSLHDSFLSYTSIDEVNPLFSFDYSKLRLRNNLSADVFIFHHSFPFSIIPPIVIGRFKVDTILMRLPQLINGCRIDISYFGI